MTIILQWIDLIWLPVMLLVVDKKQRLMVTGMFISCALMMRMQVELMEWTGFTHGFLHLLEWPVQNRAIATYNIFYALYTLLAIFSPYARGSVFLAASITIFFAAMVVSMLVMCL